MQDHMFLWWLGKHCYSLAGKFWFICSIHQTLYLQIPFIFSFTMFSKWKKCQFSVKSTWNSSLLKKIKCFGKMELWSCLKKWQKVVKQNGEYIVQWGSWWKWKIYLLFLLKNTRNVFANPVLQFVIVCCIFRKDSEVFIRQLRNKIFLILGKKGDLSYKTENFLFTYFWDRKVFLLNF